MAVNECWIDDLPTETLRPPALSTAVEADGATELPWILLETQAYVADRVNATTACTFSRCGKHVQVTLCVDRPPRVSYLCVFCRAAADEVPEQMVGCAPDVIATEGDLVLLNIVVGTRKPTKRYEADLYVYRPGGFPSLSLLPRAPPRPNIVRPQSRPARGRFFMLYLYNSEHETWTETVVSVDDREQMQQYQESGDYFLHLNTKAITIGGDDGTVGFVDLWRGILLCDLRRLAQQETQNPKLRYIPLPDELRAELNMDQDDARLFRDIAFVDGRIKFVAMGDRRPWLAASWSRTSSLEDAWRKDCDIQSSNMDVTNPQFEILPKHHQGAGDEGGPPFQWLWIMQPTLSLHDDDDDGDATVYFMVTNYDHDTDAWVIAVDMVKNKLQGVVQFDAERYVPVDFAYVHSRISANLKGAS
ncbi:hypothetical protein QOZ80_2BG0198050 [Eleusine coracana subsp. coracana]|nr:hypothetical protein QOZ80_2BG0198050 [Eleusine coracana subsp. coracana]